MKGRTLPLAAKESQLIVFLAGLSWAPFGVQTLTEAWGNPPLLAVEGMLITLTLLPLAYSDRIRFRRTTLTVGWLFSGIQILFSAPWFLIPLLFWVPIMPAGVLLLIAAGRRGFTTRLVVAALVAALPYVWLLGWGPIALF
ncbi:hypothetical protein ACIBCA_00165 [Kitasatospora sp. NPDC051170]|uniref:hypothetical protein n=1 Tax=Kitasatospora sp. NPDC051170 TaxID=3364056 RepID=UPI0037B367D6